MIIPALQDLARELPRGQRLMGIDLGDKTIGIAVGDPGHMIATPVTTIRRKKFTEDAQVLLKLIDDRQVGGLVIGWPLNMDGSEGPRCQSVKQFANNMAKLRDLPMTFWDERLSTVAVTRDMIAADLSRGKRAKVVDQSAAAFILQGALDSLKR
ncbi:Holliday junction resolvase RuvX [Dongia rigui]|uniref:Putative pre-16S rRNA nuclease n=1 Tax=Dongia rigui TaxID=940149 RepID=A0ABU5E0C6_9PROT|nr:Holliday junction resolvase RuvX [Dongia rigui]MDY0872995.1 Holliday junction resolvase RuvX [Dongia rigui]